MGSLMWIVSYVTGHRLWTHLISAGPLHRFSLEGPLGLYTVLHSEFYQFSEKSRHKIGTVPTLSHFCGQTYHMAAQKVTKQVLSSKERRVKESVATLDLLDGGCIGTEHMRMGQESEIFPICAGSEEWGFPRGWGWVGYSPPPPEDSAPKEGLGMFLIFSTVLHSCASDEPSNGLYRLESLSDSSVCTEHGKEELEFVF